MTMQKITGARLDLGDGSPHVDVDTALLDLHDELGRAGRRRQYAALGHLINVAAEAMAEHDSAKQEIETATDKLRQASRTQKR